MSKNPRPQLGSLLRRVVTLSTALSFLVLAVTGVLAFVQPFHIGVIGLHALIGFVFIGLIVLHVLNNIRPMTSYLHSRVLWVALLVVAGLAALFWWQPSPIRYVLGLSGNLGPALERFEMSENGMVFEYSPSSQYQMQLTVIPGPTYRIENPPQVAIWLENQGGYHIKTLLEPKSPSETPYWAFKRAGWEKAKLEAEKLGEVDAVSSPTPNGSFDPADYILPAESKEGTPYSVLVEINLADDGEASLVYAVEIDNTLPKTFQLLELRGYPKREENDENGREQWGLYYVDENFKSSLDLIDSALLRIERKFD